MARVAIYFAVFAAFSLVILGDDEFLLCQRTTETEELFLCSSNNTFELILNSDNTSRPCESEIMVCGIKACESKGLPEEIQYKPQSAGTSIKELAEEDEHCNCNGNNTQFFIQQDMMKDSKHHFLKCRVQEDSKTGCRGVLCDWKLINITDTSDKDDESVEDCKCRTTCLAICQLKAFVRWQDSNIDLLTAIGVMAFVSVATLAICFVFDRCMKRGLTRPYRETREMQPVSSQQPSTSAERNDNNQGNLTAANENKPVDEEVAAGESNVIVHHAPKEDDIDDALMEEIFK